MLRTETDAVYRYGKISRCVDRYVKRLGNDLIAAVCLQGKRGALLVPHLYRAGLRKESAHLIAVDDQSIRGQRVLRASRLVLRQGFPENIIYCLPVNIRHGSLWCQEHYVDLRKGKFRNIVKFIQAKAEFALFGRLLQRYLTQIFSVRSYNIGRTCEAVV